VGRLPAPERVYQNHHLDSTRWDHFKPRAGDVVIATPIKSGTTWMQAIVLHLIFQDLQKRDLWQNSFWLDWRGYPVSDVIGALEGQAHRRVIKSHLPLDGLRYFAAVKYIVVGRDPRDAFMSLWNHYSNYTPGFMDILNNAPGRIGNPMPQPPADMRAFWRGWMSTGWFDWESEGYPFWSYLRHVQTWWNFKHLRNILFVHYNDLLADLPGELERIAGYLDIRLSKSVRDGIAELVSFSSMKRDAMEINPGSQEVFKGGPGTFINRGTNGRWRDVLTIDDLSLYDAAAKRELGGDTKAWLETGGCVPTA
jgi:aryl sulfotransferase